MEVFTPNSGQIKHNVLAYGYSPMFEVKWIPVCATEGMCYSINFYNDWKDKFGLEGFEFKKYHSTKWFSILPKRTPEASKCDLKYEFCPGCQRPIYLSDSVRLNYLLGHEEPKRVMKKIDFIEGLDDFL